MHRSRSMTLAALSLLLLLVAAGCSDDNGTPTGISADTKRREMGDSYDAQVVKVGLILDAPRTDGGWSEAGFRGLDKLQKEGLVELTVSESVSHDPATTVRVTKGMADDGQQLIVAHSFSYGEALRKVAKGYPDVNFAWAGAINGVDENVADYDQPFYVASYLAGILAGGTTKGTIGALGGLDIPACHAMAEAFKAGAEVTRPGVKLLSGYVGSWTDAALAKQAALRLADQGADVFSVCGVDAGVIQAARERNLGVVGYTRDQSGQAPKNVQSSIVWHTDVVFRTMVEDIRNGRFRPAKYYSLGIAESAVTVDVNPVYKDPVKPEVKAAFDKKLAEIKSGAFKVPYITGK